MFETVKTAPADPILGLTEAFNKDPNPDKINLSVGVYKDASGKTPVLATVKEAERRLLEGETTKSYLPMPGDPTYGALVQKLMFGDGHAIVAEGRGATAHCPGGTGALRVAGDYLHKLHPGSTIWMSDPTWANHIPLLGGAGLTLKPYPYYDTEKHVIRIDQMLDTLAQAPAGDLVLLHACCHNPSGLDPSEDDWRAIADVIAERELVPFIDMAYQGFASSLATDAFAVQHMAARLPEMIVANSCSKNFGLYRDRVGTLSILSAGKVSRDTVYSQVNNVVRTIYSVPPDHGAVVVSTILNDPELKAAWRLELAAMRGRLREMRVLLNDELKVRAPDHDFSHLVRAVGMFCFLGVTPDQVSRLKKDYGVYIVDSSRINIAGITAGNVNYLAESIAAVL